jgi:hypothetical protein
MVYEFDYNTYGDIETIKICQVIVLNNAYINDANGFYTGLIDTTTYGENNAGNDTVRYSYDENRRIKEIDICK